MSSRIFALLSVVVVASLQNCRLTPPFVSSSLASRLSCCRTLLLWNPPILPPWHLQHALVAHHGRKVPQVELQFSPASSFSVFVARSLPHEAAQLRCRLASMPDQGEYPDQTHYRPDPRSSSASPLFTSQASLLPRKGPVTPMWY